MPEQDNVFKTLLDQKIVQPVNRRFQTVDARIATLRHYIWILIAFCLINMGVAIVAVYLCCK